MTFPLGPFEKYAGNVVLSEGVVHFRRRWFLYFGMADSVLGAAVWTPRVAR